MSLVARAMEELVLLNKVRSSDGEGGFTTEWSEGASISGAVVFNSSMEARIAEKSGVSSLYTITTKKSVILEYHDVLKRKSDGKIFRITSDGDDLYSPASSSLDMRQVTAEEWTLV